MREMFMDDDKGDRIDRIIMWAVDGHVHRAHAWVLEMCSRAATIARNPSHETPLAMRELDNEVSEQLRGWTGIPYWRAREVLPRFEGLTNASWTYRAHLLNAATAIACERFRIARGRWPNSLDEIPKDILAAVPLDPFTGKPLTFTRYPDGIGIKSVGKGNEPGRAPENTDIEFRLYDPNARRLPHPPLEPDHPVAFGSSSAWLAIRTEDSQAVVKALGLQKGWESNWDVGIKATARGWVFVTPAIDGWVLVTSPSLPRIVSKNEPDTLSPLVKTLSKEFEEVQYFGTHQFGEYVGWLRASNGEIVRRYAYSENCAKSSVTRQRTAEETRLELIFNDMRFPDETDATDLAGVWSIDPSKLDKLDLAVSVGWLGVLPKK